MKIRSSYKDYYDYLQGIKGIDEKVQLIRIGSYTCPKDVKDGDQFKFYIMQEIITLVYYNKRFYTHEELWEMGKKRGFVRNHFGFEEPVIQDCDKTNKWEYETHILQKPLREYEIRSYNEKFGNCPIVLIQGDEFIKFPKLTEFGMGRFFPPEEIWNKLYNWVSQVQDIPNNQTNKEKIVSHGFDVRTSFRPKIKE